MSSNLFAKLSFNNEQAILLLNTPFSAEEHVFEMVNKTRIDRIPFPGENYSFIAAFVHNKEQVTTYKEFIDQNKVSNAKVWMIVKQSIVQELQSHPQWINLVHHQQPIPVLSGWNAFIINSNQIDTDKEDHLSTKAFA